MTKEEKFKKLLEIACANGFDINSIAANFSTILQSDFQLNEPDDFSVHIGAFINSNYIIPNKTIRHWESYSLNDLVLQTNFFECLFKDFNGFNQSSIYYELYKGFETIDDVKNTNISLIQSLKFQWILEVEKGNVLEWLFKQFEL